MATKKPPLKPRANVPQRTMPDYGVEWETPPKSILMQELRLFRQQWGSQIVGTTPSGKRGNINPKGKPRWYHFVQCVDLIWNYPGSPKPFMWHPDAMTMLKAACARKRLGVAGAGSTGKSDFFAIWAIINFLANPGNEATQEGKPKKEGAMILVTSTTKSAASNRIWGKITSYWNGMIAAAPGKLIASSHSICYHDYQTGKDDHTCGIKLFAGEASKAAKSADEMRGIKGDPLILIADEMPELSHSLTNTFDENLTSNYNYQMVVLGNPNTYFDPFGEFCEPENGWDSVCDEDYEWKAKKDALVIRLNAELSPNVLEGRVIYPFLMQQDQLAEKQRNLGGRHTAKYYRGVLGMWSPTGDEDTIYSQAEIMNSEVCKRVADCKAKWLGDTTNVGGFDMAFTNGGDRSVLTFGRIGMRTDNKLTLEFVEAVEINEDTRVKNVDRTTQIITKLRAECEKRGILPENLAIDASGPGGKAFRDAIMSQWTSRFLPVDFSGAPSDKPVSRQEPKVKCKDRYDRRVSEIWFGGKALIRGDQLRGISNALAAEMVIRRYKETKPGSVDNKVIVETKREMRTRTQRSPDIADSFFTMVNICMVRHKFTSVDTVAERKSGNNSPDPVKKRFRQLQGIYAA